MKTKLIFPLLFLLCFTFVSPFFSFGLEENHVIDGNTIYVDDPKFYLSATPHTLGSSGYVVFELNSKYFEGKIDILFAFEDENINVLSKDVWLNYSHTTTKINTIEWFNVTSGLNQTLYETEIIEEYYFDWLSLEEKIKTEKYSWKNKKKWNYLTLDIEKNVNYKFRFYIDIPFRGYKLLEGEYYFAFKDHSKSIQKSIEENSLFILDPWYNTQWIYRKKLTIDNSAISENLINFPVLVHLNDTTIDWTHLQNDGTDIRFTDSDGETLLNYEIETWNDTNDAWIWVNIPQIDAGSITDSFYMYYNNSGASDGQNIEDTWNSNYEMVQHLQENTNSTCVDSTNNNFDGTPLPYASPPVSVLSGQINDCLDFDGTQDYILTSTTTSLSVFTIEVFFNAKDMAAGQPYEKGIFTHGVNSFLLAFDATAGDSRPCGLINDGSWTYIYGSTNPISSGFHYVVFSYNGSYMHLYLDGSSDATPVSSGNPNAENEGYRIGTYAATSNQWFNGTIDECRVSNVARSADWIEAQYLSMTEQFFSFGSEETRIILTVYFETGLNVYVNGTLYSNASEVEFGINNIANITTVPNENYAFYKHYHDTTNTLDNPIYLTMSVSRTVWSYSFREGATQGFMLATIFLLLFIGMPLIAIMYRRK